VINSLNNQGLSYNGSSIQDDNLGKPNTFGTSQLSISNAFQNSLHTNWFPQSYLNDSQSFTTDYTNNYPVASDVMNYNQVNQTYLYPQTNVSSEYLLNKEKQEK